MAGCRHVSSPRRPKRSDRALQPDTAPGTLTDLGPSASTVSGWATCAGAGPAASSPTISPPRCTIANASPPIPVDIGSVTPSTAAAAIAASTALPPRSSIRTPARVALTWLVATIPRAANAGGRTGAKRNTSVTLRNPGADDRAQRADRLSVLQRRRVRTLAGIEVVDGARAIAVAERAVGPRS